MARMFMGAVVALLLLAGICVGAGQAGLFAGSTPAGLGVSNGRLAPPSVTPNSVSSQAALYPGHPQQAYAAIAPLLFSGDGNGAMRTLAELLRTQEHTIVTVQTNDYLRAEVSSRWMGFRDDVEFWLDRQAGVIHVRSASRLGSKDFGVNRARVESLRARFVP